MNNYDKIWQKRYDAQVIKGRCDHKKMWYESFAQQIAHRNVVMSLLNQVKLRDKSIIVEAGCGTGFYLKELENLNKKHLIVGLDSSYNMLLEAGKVRVKQNEDMAQGILENMPLRSNSVDAVLSLSVLQTTNDLEKSLSELCRIIKPGGYLIIATLRKYKMYELMFLPLWLLMLDYGNSDNIETVFDQVKNKDELVWKEFPKGFLPKRYAFREIKTNLINNNMSSIKCYFPGRLRKIPMLSNSLHMIIRSRKVK